MLCCLRSSVQAMYSDLLHVSFFFFFFFAASRHDNASRRNRVIIYHVIATTSRNAERRKKKEKHVVKRNSVNPRNNRSTDWGIWTIRTIVRLEIGTPRDKRYLHGTLFS